MKWFFVLSEKQIEINDGVHIICVVYKQNYDLESIYTYTKDNILPRFYEAGKKNFTTEHHKFTVVETTNIADLPSGYNMTEYWLWEQ